MAQLPGGAFDASTVDPDQRPDPIPASDYVLHLIKSDMKPTRDTSGAYLECEFEVLDGQFKGRKIWDRFNLQNKSAKAEEIAWSQFSALCHATGKLQVTDSAELHNLPFVGKVKLIPAQGQYSAKNEIGGYKPVGGGYLSTPQPAAPAPTQQAQAPSPSTGEAASGPDGAQPWQRPAGTEPSPPAWLGAGK